MLMIPFRHVLFLMISLRCLHESLLGPGVDKLLHLETELMNSSSDKGIQGKYDLLRISFKISISIWQS